MQNFSNLQLIYMNNILVTGADGQLGSELKIISHNYPENNFLFTKLTDLDITNHIAVAEFISCNKITAIINCAAFTDVDKSENQRELANIINHLAVANLAKLSKINNIKLVHISTDYVFNGINSKPYVETNSPNPLSVYGQTKLDGEIAMQRINPIFSIIIRTSWLYSNFGNNFVKKILHLAKGIDQINVVSDQTSTPTNAADLAKVIMDIFPKINNKSVEIYHYSNDGFCSRYDFALELFKLKKINTFINPVKTLEFPSKVNRPGYSVLNKSKIKVSFDLKIPHWKESLSNTFENIKT